MSSPDTWSMQNFLYRGYVYPITAVSASGSSAFYTIAASNILPLPPIGATVTVAGFTSSVNNGAFTVTSNTFSTLVLANASATPESHAATGTVTALAASAGALVLTHVGATDSQFLVQSASGGSIPDISFVQDPTTGFQLLNSGQMQFFASGTVQAQLSTATFALPEC